MSAFIPALIPLTVTLTALPNKKTQVGPESLQRRLHMVVLIEADRPVAFECPGFG